MTEVAKHTPGPWAVAEINNGFGDIDVYPLMDGPPPIGRWAEICTVKDWISDGDAKANANLIAAAPDLLEAAELALSDAVADDMDGWFRALKAAVTKAKGGAA